MKKYFLVFALIALLPLLSSADTCQSMAIEWNKDEGESIRKTTELVLSELSFLEVQQLPFAVQSAILNTAISYAHKVDFPERSRVDVSFTTITQALNYLKKKSSDHEVLLQRFEVAGVIASYIEFYPGDNVFGEVFKYRTGSSIGLVWDGRVICPGPELQ